MKRWIRITRGLIEVNKDNLPIEKGRLIFTELDEVSAYEHEDNFVFRTDGLEEAGLFYQYIISPNPWFEFLHPLEELALTLTDPDTPV